eukprot:5994822-Prymnesium_polylepis.1
MAPSRLHELLWRLLLWRLLLWRLLLWRVLVWRGLACALSWCMAAVAAVDSGCSPGCAGRLSSSVRRVRLFLLASSPVAYSPVA